MNIGDLVRLTDDGVVAAWYPGMDRNAVGIVISLRALGPYPAPGSTEPLGSGWATVEWPLGRDTHIPQDLDIVHKHFS